MLTPFFLQACGGGGKSVSMEEIPLTAVDSLANVVGLPTQMVYDDGKLYVVDMFSEDSLLTVWDIASKEEVLSMGRRGEGPEEYLHIGNVDVAEGTNGRKTLYLYDPVRQRMNLFDCDSLLAGYRNRRIVNVPEDWKTIVALRRTDQGYVAIGKEPENKYVLLSDSMGFVALAGAYRPKPDANVPDDIHRMANFGKMELSTDGKTLVDIIYNASVLTCYDVKVNTLEKQWEYVGKELDYRVEGKHFVNNQVMGYLSASVGEENIYALYSGCPDDVDEIAPYGKEIHVFSRKGELLRRFSIDHAAFLLCVDERSQKAFALCHKPETIIMVYDLSL